MVNSPISLHEKRTVTGVIGTARRLVVDNSSEILRAIFHYLSVPTLLIGLTVGYLLYRIQSVGIDPDSIFDQVGAEFILGLLVIIGLGIWFGLVLVCYSLGQLRWLDQRPDEDLTAENAWRAGRRFCGRLVLLYLATMLIMIPLALIQMVPCIGAVIYMILIFPVTTATSLMPGVMVLEDREVGSTIRRTIELVQVNFWQSLGVVFLTVILVVIPSAIVLGIPIALVYAAVQNGITAFSAWLAAAMAAFLLIAFAAINMFVYTAYGLQVFNLSAQEKPEEPTIILKDPEAPAKPADDDEIF